MSVPFLKIELQSMTYYVVAFPPFYLSLMHTTCFQTSSSAYGSCNDCNRKDSVEELLESVLGRPGQISPQSRHNGYSYTYRRAKKC